MRLTSPGASSRHGASRTRGCPCLTPYGRSRRTGSPCWRTSAAFHAESLRHRIRHADQLDEGLRDGSALANLTPTGLLRALAVRWPDGVPQGGIAMDIHYLEELGLA
jgi:hypothetical protein